MRALLGLALLACTLAALPAAAEDLAPAPANAPLFAPDLEPRIGPICPLGVGEECPCVPDFSACTKEWHNPPVFKRQKPNGKCIYVCSFTETCEDTRCGEEDQVTFGTQRMRLGPYPLPDGCPDVSEVSCPNGEMLPPGEPD
jgi:hypothetical protein